MMEHCWDTDWFCWSSESEQCVSAKWRLTPLTCPLRAFGDILRSWVCVRRRTGWQKRVEECVRFCCERTDPHHYLTLGAAGFPIMGKKALSPFMLIAVIVQISSDLPAAVFSVSDSCVSCLFISPVCCQQWSFHTVSVSTFKRWSHLSAAYVSEAAHFLEKSLLHSKVRRTVQSFSPHK